MTSLRIVGILICAILLGVASPLAADSLPEGTVWYTHADLERMRTSESGKALYAWFEDEVAEELKEEVGIDLTQEIDRVTAFSDTGTSATVIVEGAVSEALQKKLMALAVLKGDVEERDHAGKPYFMFEEAGGGGHREFRETYFSFAVDGKILATSDENQMRSLVDTNGQFSGDRSHSDALFVLTAEKGFVQAGMRPGEFSEQFDDDGWNSRIIRNTEQAVVFVSDSSGLIAVEARLVSSDPDMTQSIGNIVSGLISLQAFNDELDAPLLSVLQSTKVDVAGEVLTVSTVVSPDTVLEILDD